MGACQGLLQFFTCALFFNANHSDPRLQQAKASKSKQKQAKASKSKQKQATTKKRMLSSMRQW
jgi:hypothetical protein